MSSNRANGTPASSSWRSTLPIHPAAELSPRMSPDELRALGEDIVKSGLKSPIVLWRPDPRSPPSLLDGINRLDAIEIATGSPVIVGAPSIVAGEHFLACDKVLVLNKSIDPYSYVISANIRRRHLTAKQKRDLIAKIIRVTPEKSNNAIAKQMKVDDKTVGKVRREMEGRSEIPNVETRTDTRGRKQPAKRNPTRARLHREAKLGPEVVGKLEGTSLASAREQDELIVLNRGAAEGEHTEIVQDLVARAVKGEGVSAVSCAKTGAAFRRDDIGANSSGEIARKLARLEQLEAENARLRRENLALRSEVEELKARLLDIPAFLDRTH